LGAKTRLEWSVSNILQVSLQTTIYSLNDQGWSRRRIARELSIDRETVGRHLQRRAKPAISITGSDRAGDPKPAISIPGSESARDPKPAISMAGWEPIQDPKPAILITGSELVEDSKPAISMTGKGAGRTSRCEHLAPFIAVKVEAGLSGQRIYQDLVLEHGFADSYQSVQRYVRRLKETQPERVWRLECQPGEEAQVDFGLGAPIVDPITGKRRQSWVLRVILSYSRKGYSEAVTRQDTESFLRCLENALRSFGGVPLMLNVDNLKAAVIKADWFDPVINPKMADFCRHYGTHVVPCRSFTPQHKGKVERGVAYVCSNGLKGLQFESAIDARGPEALRSLMALCELIKKHTATALNAACGKALATGTHRIKDVKRFLGEHTEQACFGFAQSHPFIRDLKTYSDFIDQHSLPDDKTQPHDPFHDQHPQATCA
jgi:transposase